MNKSGTNIGKEAKKPLLGVRVDISEEERLSLNTFFSFRGMKSAFLQSYTQYNRRDLYAALETGNVKTTLLADVRAFVEDHKAEVEEFIKDQNAA